MFTKIVVLTIYKFMVGCDVLESLIRVGIDGWWWILGELGSGGLGGGVRGCGLLFLGQVRLSFCVIILLTNELVSQSELSNQTSDLSFRHQAYA